MARAWVCMSSILAEVVLSPSAADWVGEPGSSTSISTSAIVAGGENDTFVVCGWVKGGANRCLVVLGWYYRELAVLKGWWDVVGLLGGQAQG